MRIDLPWPDIVQFQNRFGHIEHRSEIHFSNGKGHAEIRMFLREEVFKLYLQDLTDKHCSTVVYASHGMFDTVLRYAAEFPEICNMVTCGCEPEIQRKLACLNRLGLGYDQIYWSMECGGGKRMAEIVTHLTQFGELPPSNILPRPSIGNGDTSVKL